MTAAARFASAVGVSVLVVLAAVGAVLMTAGRAGPDAVGRAGVVAAGREAPEAVGPVVPIVAEHAGADADGLTDAQAAEIVGAHNAWRQRVGVMSLRWAPDLAARAWARALHLAAHGCVIVHGPLPVDIGENLYWVSALQHEAGRADELFVVTATDIVDAWGEESADYNPVDDTCALNRQCGHYTQIVWNTTEEVGCGMAVCPTLGQVWVCNYRPAGNVRRAGFRK